jgi:Zn-dependent protease with chaperone function
MTEAGLGIAARYYDGLSSASRRETATVSALGLSIGGGQPIPATALTIVEPIGQGFWQIALPDGAMLELDGSDGAILAKALGHRETPVRRWERSLKLALLAIPLLILSVWGASIVAVPLMADIATDLLPPGTDQAIGASSLLVIDRMTSTSNIPSDRRQALRQRFKAMARDIVVDPLPYKLEFRDAPSIGPNAFALPGGTVVATDQMLAILTDDEVIAILAHELGHVEHRHGVRTVFRSFGLGILAAAVLGDASTLGNVLTALPVLMTQLSYSRGFEDQADGVAFQWLAQPGRSPCDFATGLHKLQAAIDARSGGKSKDPTPSWLATHPGTAERVKRFETECHRLKGAIAT